MSTMSPADERVAPDLAAVDAELQRMARPDGGNAGQGLWLMALSAGLFVSAQQVFGGGQPWVFVGLLLAVLVIHELGHLAAMRAFGFRDLRMFFIPLFGAAAAGNKPDATGTQRAVVALAGPLPGIALGLALLLGVGPAGLGEVGAMFTALLLFVNFVNLAPLLPFDGGHLVNILLFSRWPVVELWFRLATAGLLGWWAYTRGSAVVGVLAAFMLLGASWQGRVARLGRSMRAQVPAPRPAALLATAPAFRAAAIWETVRTMQLNPYAPRAARVIASCMSRGWERALDSSPGLAASLALLGLYAAVLAGGFLLWRTLAV